MSRSSSRCPELDPSNLEVIGASGARISPLDPIGAEVRGIDLNSEESPSTELLEALELEMARQGFLVFKSEQPLGVDGFLRASCWWGGRELHSTHGVHPSTPDGNRHIFRLSNDSRHGIPGVGPQWHNDGSFIPETFSHAGYHIVRPAENGGGTCFAHQAAAYDTLTPEQQEYWGRLSSVNSASGVVHPVVHEHPLTGRKSIWLHLGMTGAVIEKEPDAEGFRLLDEAALTRLCREYNDVLDAGLDNGYAIAYEYQENDCIFIDNFAVAHRAAPEAHRPADEQGLRIMHRSTIRSNHRLAPGFGLPYHVGIQRSSPYGNGVWQAGGIGFRWDQHIAMQN